MALAETSYTAVNGRDLVESAATAEIRPVLAPVVHPVPVALGKAGHH
jgi:hypothetical protein